MTYVPCDYSLADIGRFTELSIRRGIPLANLVAAEPRDRRLVAGAALLPTAGRRLTEEELRQAFADFLAGAADWLVSAPDELKEICLAEGLLERTGGGYANHLEPLPGVTMRRLLDELEAARTILAERRARMRESLQARNRTVNAAPSPAADPEADRRFMREALREAQAAFEAGEVPVGAVVVKEGEIVARGANETLRTGDPTAHAEVVAIRRAARALCNHRIGGTTLYVTLEPCPMCAGAIAEARCARIVYGAPDARRGALEGALRLFDIPGVNHRPVITGGVLAEEGAKLVKTFFEGRRSAAREEDE
ncbi:tRNA adenosine(34) deaminase TadA [Sutterella sp.]|uniref:tRNA adenosine(34) deaminase TadA n=1 Tax=Sutterella sp. TaxID=1981025 RepID=UPI0026DFAE83|nr:tRNA adenosine(34) deaminase TadA [Sutterella sp.]MDO5531193.1 tRNA adenosine(34) deaminase TadA [Sutterella sp.]